MPLSFLQQVITLLHLNTAFINKCVIFTIQPSNREIMDLNINNLLYTSELLTVGNFTLTFEYLIYQCAIYTVQPYNRERMDVHMNNSLYISEFLTE